MYKKILFTAIILASVAFSGSAIAEQNQGYKNRAQALESVRKKLGKADAPNLDRKKLHQQNASPRARKVLKRLKKRMKNLSPEQRKHMLKRITNQRQHLRSPQKRLRNKGARRDMKKGRPSKQKQLRRNLRKRLKGRQAPRKHLGGQR